MEKNNIILIGMPSAGKTTIGKLLASKLNMDFTDTDALIIKSEKKTPKEIVTSDGLERFLEVQENVVRSLNVQNYIIATGGSVIYSEAAIEHLKKTGTIIYLNVDYDEIVQRVASGRRFARAENQSFRDVYEERKVLYEKYAEIVVNSTGKKKNEVASEIIAILNGGVNSDRE